MDMVFYAANSNRVTTNISYDTTKICEILWQVCLFYTEAGALDVEHYVDVEFCVGVSHRCLFLCAVTHVDYLLLCHPNGVLVCLPVS